MAYKIYDKGKWVLVEFTGDVDAFDVFTQNQEPGFLDMLVEKSGMIADYSQAKSVNMSAEEIKSFARIANMQAEFTGPINVVIIPRPVGVQNAQAFKQLLDNTDWRVQLAQNMSDAIVQVTLPMAKTSDNDG